MSVSGQSIAWFAHRIGMGVGHNLLPKKHETPPLTLFSTILIIPSSWLGLTWAAPSQDKALRDSLAIHHPFVLVSILQILDGLDGGAV